MSGTERVAEPSARRTPPTDPASAMAVLPVLRGSEADGGVAPVNVAPASHGPATTPLAAPAMPRAARYALTILQNRSGGVPARPSWCTFLVTYRCNARCKMCDSWRVKPGSEMTVAQIDGVFSRIGGLDVVRLTGGEPFLREDMGDIARVVLARSSPVVLHVTTNGSFPDRVAAFARGLVAEGHRERLAFLVSFDGMPDEHDGNRGDDVTFALALETVRRLVAAGLRVSANHTVISERSLRDNAAIRATLEPLGVDVHSVLAYSDSAMYSLKLRGKKAEHLIRGRGYPLHPALQGADVVGFVERELSATARMRPRERAGKRYYLRGLLARLRGDSKPSQPRCVALRSHLRLLPDGRVPVCQFNTETVGNADTQPFDAVWRSAAADEARAWVDACVGCWAECEVIPSAIYTGDIARAVV